MRSQWFRVSSVTRFALVAALNITGPFALAQTNVAASAPAASAPEVPPPLRPSPLVTSPSDAQRTLDSDNEPAGGKVVPQLRIPLGKKAGAPVFERHRPQTTAASSPASLVNDSAARCDSEVDKDARARCRRQQVRQ